MDIIQQNSGRQLDYDSPNRQRLSHHLAHPVQSIEMRATPVQLGVPATHYESTSSIMASRFTRLSCNSFSLKSPSCTIGNYVEYAVKVTDPAHV